jgi:hypothetical protein
MKRVILIHIDCGTTACGECVYKAPNYGTGAAFFCTNPEFNDAEHGAPELERGKRLEACLLAGRLAERLLEQVSTPITYACPIGKLTVAREKKR